MVKFRRKIRKNDREKQRRSELNNKFDALSDLLQLGRFVIFVIMTPVGAVPRFGECEGLHDGKLLATPRKDFNAHRRSVTTCLSEPAEH